MIKKIYRLWQAKGGYLFLSWSYLFLNVETFETDNIPIHIRRFIYFTFQYTWFSSPLQEARIEELEKKALENQKEQLWQVYNCKIS